MLKKLEIARLCKTQLVVSIRLANMTPEAILAAVQAFQILEPEVQRGIVALYHLAHGTPPLTPQDYINQAIAMLAKTTPTPP